MVRVPQMMIYDLNISLSEDNFHLTKSTNFVKGFLRFIYHSLCTLMNDIFNQKMTIVRSRIDLGLFRPIGTKAEIINHFNHLIYIK